MAVLAKRDEILELLDGRQVDDHSSTNPITAAVYNAAGSIGTSLRPSSASRRPPTTQQGHREDRASAACPDERLPSRLPTMIPGIEPTSSAPISDEVDRAHQPVADAGDQRQRHGVGDVAAGDPRDRQLGVEDQQRGRAERPGADRSDRHEHARGSRRGASSSRGRALRRMPSDVAGERMIRGRNKTATPVSSSAQPSSRLRTSELGRSVVPTRLITIERERSPPARCRGKPPNDPPIDRLAVAVDGSADALGHRRIEQVGADRGRAGGSRTAARAAASSASRRRRRSGRRACRRGIRPANRADCRRRGSLAPVVQRSKA